MRKWGLAGVMALLPLMAAAQTDAPTPRVRAETAPRLHGPEAMMTLKTTCTSRKDTAGSVFKAVLDKPLELTADVTLPRGTEVYGHIAMVSAHSKAKPNGALLLVFDEARPKNGPAIALRAQIVRMGAAAATETGRDALPHARLGGTSNSGGSEQLSYERMDRSAMATNTPMMSGLANVYLDLRSGGSGMLFAAGEDIYLDSGLRIYAIVVPAPAPVLTNAQPATARP